MTTSDIKKDVQKHFNIGQAVTIRLDDDDRATVKSAKVIIKKFYPNHVMVERNGFMESYTYWDFRMKTRPKELKNKIILPKEFSSRTRNELQVN